MVVLKTKVSVSDINRVRDFLYYFDIGSYDVAWYEMRINSTAVVRNVFVSIPDHRAHVENDMILKLKTGKTLLQHINCNCISLSHHSGVYNWNGL